MKSFLFAPFGPTPTLRHLLSLLALTAPLTACGGGDSSASSAGSGGATTTSAGGTTTTSTGGTTTTSTGGTSQGGNPQGGTSTGGTSTGGTSQGGSGLCIPGSSVPCYTGPDGTVGVGVCKVGSQICLPDGVTLGPCEGDVHPSAEDCATPEDEDCDGVSNGGCACAPNTLEACYDGPAGTAGVGKCKSGTHVCNADGSGFTACTGEVLPSVETCATGIDDDCDGTDACTALGVWSKLFDSAVKSLFVAPYGEDILIAGDLQGTTDLGGGPLVGAGFDTDIFVARFDKDGAHLWSKVFPAPQNQNVRGIATSSSGKLVIAGDYVGSPDFGFGALPAAVNTATFVLQMTAATGVASWSKPFSSTFGMFTHDAAMDATGNLLIGGRFGGTLTLGPVTYPSAGIFDGIVYKLTPNGDVVWSRQVGTPDSEIVRAVGFDSQGDAFITGSIYNPSVDLGGGPLPSVGGSEDLYIAKYDPSGAYLWAKRFTGPGNQQPTKLAVSVTGDVAVSGLLEGTMDLGGGVTLSQPAGTGGFLVALEGMTGNPAYGIKLGALSAMLTGVAARGNFFGAIGYMTNTATFGAYTVESLGSAPDVFLGAVDLDGNPSFAARLGGPNYDYGNGLAYDAANATLLWGQASGPIDFGNGVTITAQTTQQFLTKTVVFP